MSILGSYPEPHSRLPGAPYVREQLPSADLNQIVANQKAIWNGVNAGGVQLIEEGDLGDGTNRAYVTTSSTSYVSVTDSWTTSVITAAIGDLVTGSLGPIRVVNSDASHAATLNVFIAHVIASAQTLEQSLLIDIPANVTAYLTIPYRNIMQVSGQVQVGMYVQAGSAGSVTVTALPNCYTFGYYRIERKP